MPTEIDLGTFDDYHLYLSRPPGMPATLEARCADRKRCRLYSPKLLGQCMIVSNAAIREAFRRAIAGGYAQLVA